MNIFIFYVIFMALGQFLFSKTSKSTQDIMQIFYSPYFWSAVFIYGIASIVWVLVLKKIPLHLAYPLGAGLTTVVITAYSLFIKELNLYMLPKYLLGVLLTISGSFLLYYLRK